MASLSDVNAIRRRYNRRPLRDDARLARAAQELAERIAATHRVSHEDFNGRLTRCGYPYAGAAENAALCGSIEAALDMWLRSGAHRINLLGVYQDAGLAIVPAGNGQYAFVLTLASPRPARTAPEKESTT